MDEGRYVVMCVMGPDQTGKTHFAFTSPPPILVLTYDPVNLRGVAKKYRGTDIHVAEFELPKGLIKTEALSKKAAEEQNRYRETMAAALTGDYFRTVIMDREDEAWETWRYSEFDDGKAKAHHYTPLNTDYKAMLKMAAKNKKNLIMIDNVKDEWKNNQPTGKTVKEGFKHLGLLTEVTLETIRDDYDNFSIQVRSNRDDPSKNGVIVTAENLNAATGLEEGLTFPNLMGYLIEGSTADEWR